MQRLLLLLVLLMMMVVVQPALVRQPVEAVAATVQGRLP